MEGFGLPAVEAMACGTPGSFQPGWLAARKSSAMQACISTRPTVGSIADAIRSFLDAPSHRDALARLALERSPSSPGKNPLAGCSPALTS